MNNKKKKIMIFIVLLILALGLVSICYIVFNKKDTKNLPNKDQEVANLIENNNSPKPKKELPWELTLANADNKIPEDYKFELENIDSSRQFDSRAIEYLREMMKDIRKSRYK